MVVTPSQMGGLRRTGRKPYNTSCALLIEQEEIVMAKVCQYCGRGPVTGNAVSHSNRHTRRRWLVNLQTVRIDAGDGTTFKVRVCTKCLKSGFVKRAAATVA